VPSAWHAIGITRTEYNQLKNNEFFADSKAATQIGKAANGKQLPLFAGIVKANPPNPLFQRGKLTVPQSTC
jgi:hypothetical protein